jgi:WD40 repeat protein
VAISNDGVTLASGSEDLNIKLWNLNTGQETNNISGQVGKVLAVTFSPDDRTIAYVGSDKIIKPWNIETKKEILSISGHLGLINSLAFSLDGKTLLSFNKETNAIAWT